MHIIDYNSGMKVVNVEQLPRGTGAKYLEVIAFEGDDKLIAVKWRRTKPKTIPKNHALIQFK